LSNFFEKVYKLAEQVPFGKVTTYGAIANNLGFPRSGRMIGWAMRQAPSNICWYRVIKKTGELSFPEFSESFNEQKNLLQKENITFTDNKHVDLKKHFWCNWENPG